MKDEKLFSTAELARIYDLDRATVGKRLAGVPHRSGPRGAKLYKIEDVHNLLAPSVTECDLEEARLRKARAEAERIEILVAKLKGDLVSVRETRRTLHSIFKSLYHRVVILFPRAASGRLVGIKDRAEMEARLREELAEIFDELRTDPDNFIADAGAGDSVRGADAQ